MNRNRKLAPHKMKVIKNKPTNISYGLTDYVQSGDSERTQRVARQLRAGMVQVNGAPRASGSPFGGYKQSGNGREGGVEGFEEFLETKAVSGWTTTS